MPSPPFVSALPMTTTAALLLVCCGAVVVASSSSSAVAFIVGGDCSPGRASPCSSAVPHRQRRRGTRIDALSPWLVRSEDKDAGGDVIIPKRAPPPARRRKAQEVRRPPPSPFDALRSDADLPAARADLDAVLPFVPSASSLNSSQMHSFTPAQRYVVRVAQLMEYNATKERTGIRLRKKADRDLEKQLVSWIKTQQYERRLSESGRDSYMTPERIKLLDLIHFEWRPVDEGARNTGLTKAWLKRWEELRDFREREGHACMPQHYEENTGLGTWAKNQRYQLSRMNRGLNSPMTQERKEKLDELGFVWDGRLAAGVASSSGSDAGLGGVTANASAAAAATTNFDRTWSARLDDLKEFRREHGHVNVLQTHGSLGIWVKNQRAAYKSRALYGASFLTDARIQQLEELGFRWDGMTAQRKRASLKRDDVAAVSE